MSDPGVLDGDLVDLTARLGAAEISPGEVVEAALARIATDGRAFVAVEADRAIAEAKRLSAIAPDQRGPLAGAPYARKDLFGRSGYVFGAGSPLRANAVAAQTADVLASVDNAGGIDLGRLHMAEFALSPTGSNAHTPHPENPWNPLYPSGGSSSGSAIAVAAGQVSFALGSDTGGSIRTPAGMCGLTGIKPTYGWISSAGCFPLAWSLDCMGPLAHSARDCALLLSIMSAGSAPAPDLDGDLRGMRLAVPGGFYAEGLAPEVAQNLAATIEVLRGRGAEIIHTALPDMDLVHAMTGVVMSVEAATVLGPYLRQHPDQVGIQIHKRVQPGFEHLATSYAQALRSRVAITAEWLDKALGGADAAILPLFQTTVPTIESTLGTPEAMLAAASTITRFTRGLNYLGLPAVSVPSGFDPHGLPMAVQLVGRPFADMTVLKLADAYQRDSDVHRRRPYL
ncbi:MAG TPA: amidase [Arsenicitalea sp.]|jgi:aspartyl-tRNA(Asn)/glutamyl-tRNA(Gln) amidotransferase subunit A|nr:amidase [Arsenicitalea sp.]